MSSIIFSILGIYIFIVMGYVAKMTFKDEIDDKTITLINVYFLQVFLTFWGLLINPIDISLLHTTAIYLSIVLIALIISFFVARKLFSSPKEYSIATVIAIIGNTGNLGIPINIAIFGEQSIPYTTIVNLANVLVVYTLGVFIYSRGTYNTSSSLKNILKIPILWAAMIAIGLSIYGYQPSGVILNTLMMGAYASMTMQLFLFGIYMHGTKIKEVSKKLIIWVLTSKFIIIPTIGFLMLLFVDIEPMIKGIIFIELMMPLAVANVNLASLYDCKPRIVTALVFLSSVIFLGIIFFSIEVLKFL